MEFPKEHIKFWMPHTKGIWAYTTLFKKYKNINISLFPFECDSHSMIENWVLYVKMNKYSNRLYMSFVHNTGFVIKYVSMWPINVSVNNFTELFEKIPFLTPIKKGVSIKEIKTNEISSFEKSCRLEIERIKKLIGDYNVQNNEPAIKYDGDNIINFFSFLKKTKMLETTDFVSQKIQKYI